MPPDLSAYPFHLHELLAGVDAVIWEADAVTWRFTFVSRYAEQLLGYPLSRWDEGLRFWIEIIHPEDRKVTVGTCMREIAAGRDHRLEYRMRTSAGRIVWVRDLVHLVRSENGELTRLRGVMIEITPQKEAEEALVRSERLFRSLIEHAQEIVVILGPDGEIRYQSPSVVQLFGWTPEELAGRRFQEILDPRDAHIAGEWPQPGVSATREILIRHKDGGERVLEAIATNLIHDPCVNGIVINGRDITERRNAEEAMRRSDDRFRVATTAANVLVYDWAVGVEGIEWIGDVDSALGYAPGGFPRTIEGWKKALHPADRERVIAAIQRALESAGVFHEEYRIQTAAGTWRYWLDHGSVLKDGKGVPSRIIGACLDITDQRQLEEQLREGQRMEAIGRLAGGIAHDFNNLLTIINGYSQQILRRLSPHDPLRKSVAEIARAGERSAALTQQLLAFSRKQLLHPQSLDLNRIIGDMQELIGSLIGQGITLQISLDPLLGRVRADSSQLEQIIMNLVVNARDAMPSGGSLLIETGNIAIDENWAKLRETPPGAYALLAVTDTGVGMDDQTRARIFEPFFTTKELGRGTGLGLATVYGIVRQSGGYISVYSKPGQGATFRVHLPISGKAGPAPYRTERRIVAAAEPATILLVEDEPGVRELVHLALTQAGHVVLAASNAADALRLVESRSPSADLLVTDVVMPGLSGPELAARLRRTMPKLGVLYMSGFTDKALSNAGLLEPDTRLLRKPFTMDQLLAQTNELLRVR
ncbi:MAG: PAS domain-containing protein [Bryobacteraceae bacterium]